MAGTFTRCSGSVTKLFAYGRLSEAKTSQIYKVILASNLCTINSSSSDIALWSLGILAFAVFAKSPLGCHRN
jgi:hypothetical protein